MQQWEYQVIRLNIEPPVPPGAPGGPQPMAGGAAQTNPNQQQNPSAAGSDARPAAGAAHPPAQVFSEAYLREEFPRFYDPNAQVQQNAQAQQADPAFQLKDFLNSHGQQGWELVGFQHAAPHVFIVFKRPNGVQDAMAAALAAQGEQLRLTLDLANRALAIIEKQQAA